MNKPRLRFFFFLLQLCLPFYQAVAQGKYIVRQFNTENGLPSNGVKGLQWDEQTGFLWMATEAGIVRFNGVDFLSFSKENTPAITSERMVFMIRNHSGTIYAAGQSGDVVTINQNKPVPWKYGELARGRVYRFSLVAVSDTFFTARPNVPVFGAYSVMESRVAALSDTALLMLRSNEVSYFSISMPAPQKIAPEAGKINIVFKIGSRSFMANSAGTVYRLNPLTGSAQKTDVVMENGEPVPLTEKNHSLHWENGMENPVFIRNGKAWLFNWKNDKIVAELVIEDIPGDVLIRQVQYSRKNKTLFIGTDSKGLMVVNPARVQPMKRNAPNTRNRNSYYAQVELPDGNILTNEGDIIGTHLPMINPLPVKNKFGFTIARVNDSVLWFPGIPPGKNQACLHRYNFSTRKTTVFPKVLLREYTVTTESGGETYIADGRGIGLLENDSIRFIQKRPDEKNSDIIYDIKEEQPGVLLLASCYGLTRFHTRTGVMDTLFHTGNICVRTIWKYRGYFFFGTYGSGFFVMKNGIVKKMPLDKNKYLLYTHCFIPDQFGFCWISTNRGMFKAQLSDLLDAYETGAPQVYYHYFGRNDGMDITEMNGGCLPCGLAMKNGTLSFPTMDGLLWVQPETANPIMPEGNIFIDRFTTGDRTINPELEKRVRLPASTREIQIQLGFSAWCNKENILLEYRLSDKEKWQPVDVQNGAVVKLNNLPPGDYTLRIRKMNGFGVNNYSYQAVEFTIITPWHKQWWFYMLVTGAVAAIVVLYLRIRTRQYKIRQVKLEQQVREKTRELQQQNEILEKNNTIKTRLISIISHDIVTPLKFLTVAGKNLVDKKQMMSEDLQQETIKEIINTSQELQLLSTNILNWIKYQNENRQLVKEQLPLYELVNQVLGVLQSLARQKKLNLVNTVNKTMALFQYLEPVKILVYNLVTNAINFTEQGDIVISAVATGNSVTLTVKDSGVGMTPEQVRNILSEQIIISSANIDNRRGNGLGYLIIKDLVKMTDARLQIKSKKGEGTEVSIVFEVGATHPA